MIEQLKTQNQEARKQEMDGERQIHLMQTEVRELQEHQDRLEKEGQLIKETATVKEREIRAA